ncbi:MAG: hypothetical protein DHS20C15_33410 [Planctomycetota bacterium]|nr:MAG: hypothetical protein DHS20C15_33410 [Planctomycetota bacterium]
MYAIRLKSLLFPALVILLGAASLTAQLPSSDPDREWTQPEAYHVGSYDSRLAGKIAADGTIDTGFVQARFLRGDGTPLDFFSAHVLVARLKALAAAYEGEVGVGLSTLAVAHRAGGDDRLLMPAALRLENLSAETVELRMGVALSAGAGAGLDRPRGAVDFPGQATFTREGRGILRDGLLALSWVGGEPESVEVQEVSDPETAGARIFWTVTLEPGAVRSIEVRLAGPPTHPDADHAAWRKSVERQTMGLLEEELSWQSNYFGEAVSFYPADNVLRWMVLGGQMLIRAQGVAHQQVEWLTDRPFGHEPTDAAVPAELLAALFEWGQSLLGVDYLELLVNEAELRAEGLSPERRLAYVHSLARCMRLRGEAHPQAEQLAKLIVEWVREPLAVSPWLDPVAVRSDLLEILQDGGVVAPSDFPELKWAEVEDADSLPGKFLAHRRALSAGEQAQAWDRLQDLMLTLSPQGYGAMVPGQVPSSSFAAAAMTAARECLIDDHNGSLTLFPGVDYGLMEHRVPAEGCLMPTRFGITKAQMHYAGRKNMGVTIGFQEMRAPEEFLIKFIPSVVGGDVGITEGGRVRKVKSTDNVFKVLQYGPFAPLGLRFSMNVTPQRAVD